MEGDDNKCSPASANLEDALVDCGICGFAGVESVCMAHADAEHAMRPVYECGHCGFVFWKQFDLSLHLQQVHNTPRGKPARECMFCAILFDTPVALNSHLREVHATSQPIMCRFCGVICHGGDMVARHVHEAHASSDFLYCNAAKPLDASGFSDSESGRCTAYFMSSVALAEHMALGHSVPLENLREPTESEGSGSGWILTTKVSHSAFNGTENARQRHVHVATPVPTRASAGLVSAHASAMNTRMDISADVPSRDANVMSKNEDHLNRSPLSPEINVACVVCGLRMRLLKDLNDHMSLLHRTSEAAPVNITHESLEAAFNESSPSSDGRKRWARVAASISKQKNKAYKPARWSSELDEIFLREIREKGFSNDTLAAFQVLHTSDRSIASLRARGYRKGYKMVRSTLRGRHVQHDNIPRPLKG